ncbi:unnamed protein product [Linum trigynum]|uniref:DNA-directed RNA polymerase RpoA/D/Rpb3-type domain-containing protein n=1 Tax=Linum trigynum TaxID=586398 RepID=A0AAV2DE61_9ROSI
MCFEGFQFMRYLQWQLKKPRLFEYLSANDTPNEKNTIVRCKRGECRTVYYEELEWLPNGSKLIKEAGQPYSKPTTYTSFTCSQDTLPELSSDPISPLEDKMILAKLGSKREIELEAHYIEDEDAEELVKKRLDKVFDVEDIGHGNKRATVARPRDCRLCRECVRGEGCEEHVELCRVKDHFIFIVESTGVLPPEVLFTEVVKILEDKCERVISEIS